MYILNIMCKRFLLIFTIGVALLCSSAAHAQYDQNDQGSPGTIFQDPSSTSTPDNSGSSVYPSVPDGGYGSGLGTSGGGGSGTASDPGGGLDDPDATYAFPFDGSILILLAAGAGYGALRIRRNNRKSLVAGK